MDAGTGVLLPADGLGGRPPGPAAAARVLLPGRSGLAAGRLPLQAGGETEVGGRRGVVAVGRWYRDGEPPGPGYFWPGNPAEQVEAIVDTELAILLRLTGFIEDQPVICYEMRGLRAGVANTGAFDVPPGAHSRGPLNHLGLTPAGAAKKAAWLGAAGASSLVGMLILLLSLGLAVAAWRRRSAARRQAGDAARGRAGDAEKNLHHPT